MAEIPLGPGGPTEEIEQAAEQLDILEFPKQPNITELEDGAAIVGEMPQPEEMPKEERKQFYDYPEITEHFVCKALKVNKSLRYLDLESN